MKGLNIAVEDNPVATGKMAESGSSMGALNSAPVGSGQAWRRTYCRILQNQELLGHTFVME